MIGCIENQDNFSQENMKAHSVFGLMVFLENSLTENRDCLKQAIWTLTGLDS